ncbi:MAG: cysteine-rich CWC family protein, partial [Ottowia sp.]
MEPTPDPACCPLCGGPNGCAMAAPQAADGALPACWCMAADFPPALLARVPPAARRRAC